MEGPPSTPALQQYLDRLGVTLEPGWRAEVTDLEGRTREYSIPELLVMLVVAMRLNVRVLSTRMNAGFVHKRGDCMQVEQAAQDGAPS